MIPTDSDSESVHSCGRGYQLFMSLLNTPRYKHGLLIFNMSIGLKEECYYVTSKNFGVYDGNLPEVRICMEHQKLKDYFFLSDSSEGMEFINNSTDGTY